MRSSTGRQISKEKREPTAKVKNRAIAKNIKYSVSRLTTAEIGHRHEYKYQASSNMGANDKAKGDSIAAITKAIVAYTFRKTVICRLCRLIISSV